MLRIPTMVMGKFPSAHDDLLPHALRFLCFGFIRLISKRSCRLRLSSKALCQRKTRNIILYAWIWLLRLLLWLVLHKLFDNMTLSTF